MRTVDKPGPGGPGLETHISKRRMKWQTKAEAESPSRKASASRPSGLALRPAPSGDIWSLARRRIADARLASAFGRQPPERALRGPKPPIALTGPATSVTGHFRGTTGGLCKGSDLTGPDRPHRRQNGPYRSRLRSSGTAAGWARPDARPPHACAGVAAGSRRSRPK
jgi:hypothetical protein